MNSKLNRRDFLRLTGLTTAGLVLAACGAAGEAPANHATSGSNPETGEQLTQTTIVANAHVGIARTLNNTYKIEVRGFDVVETNRIIEQDANSFPLIYNKTFYTHHELARRLMNEIDVTGYFPDYSLLRVDYIGDLLTGYEIIQEQSSMTD